MENVSSSFLDNWISSFDHPLHLHSAIVEYSVQ